MSKLGRKDIKKSVINYVILSAKRIIKFSVVNKN